MSCPVSIPMGKMVQRKSNSPPCLCKKRRDKDGAAARVNLVRKAGPAPEEIMRAIDERFPHGSRT
jgi:hypothetical protein